MRTAAEFNQFYSVRDPWQISGANFRDKVLRRCVVRYVSGKSVLELGCGEGHLTQSIFDRAKSVVGIDISDVAIERAKERKIPNANFECSDFLRVPFDGIDVIVALECLYYLTPEDQQAFFRKVAAEHSGKILIVSGPIIGANEYRRYFDHTELLDVFANCGATILKYHNLNVYRRGILANIAAILVRLPFGNLLLDWLPTSLIYQRCYIIRMM